MIYTWCHDHQLKDILQNDTMHLKNMTLRMMNNLQNDIEHYDIQHNNTQHSDHNNVVRYAEFHTVHCHAECIMMII